MTSFELSCYYTYMDIKPFKRSKNRHTFTLESSDECYALADGLAHADYNITADTIDRIGSVSNLTLRLEILADQNSFPTEVVIPTKRLSLLVSGLATRFTVLAEPRHIHDPVYSEVGDDVATIVSQYVESQPKQTS